MKRGLVGVSLAVFTLAADARGAPPGAADPRERPAHDAPRAPARDDVAARILTKAGPRVAAVVAAAAENRFQVLFSPVVGGASPHLERHGFRLDAEYFYPASSIKIGLAVAAYERLFELRTTGVAPAATRASPLVYRPLSAGEAPSRTSLEYETWRALTVSNNDGANRLLQLAGHRALHERLWSLGMASVRVRTGFATGARDVPAEVSPAIDVGDGQGRFVNLPEQRSDLVLPPTTAPRTLVGEARMERGRRVAGGVSFAEKNAIGLSHLQDLLICLLRPELLPPPRPPAIAPEDVAYLRDALRTLPSESGIPGYDRNVVADTNLKTYLAGVERVVPRGGFELYSKIGQAYGFTIDNAYVVERSSGRAFFLTVAIYTNPNETMNDDVYAYASVAKPVLADVAEAFAREVFAPPP